MKIKIYDRIVGDIENAIRSGALKPGEKLPPYSELAAKYCTSVVTVRKSITALVSSGYLESVERVGIFVREREKEVYLIAFSPIANINEEITRCAVEGISHALVRIGDDREERRATELKRIFYSDAIPVGYEITALLLGGHYNSDTLPEMTEKNLDMIQKILNGFEVKKVLEITMDMPRRYIQEKLLVDETTPLFCFATTYYTTEDKPVGRSMLYVAGENVELYGKSFLK
ncbi:MAG: GntR family transcriptional regulator [Eubacterium sp.]|nr:GntR family transcriptional regulator [Eubacterium sp.]